MAEVSQVLDIHCPGNDLQTLRGWRGPLLHRMRPAPLALLALLLCLTACGKKGSPSPPGPPDQVSYPRSYPAY